ncbi:methyltransferase domain-containing protein [Streptomyces sp. NPDC020875]|uniref:SAM-dependent methyltransferase n=1 Tax=Streptomyces sp. NPDC020875 TaxID=3154898 RepID=UPI00340F5FCE
MGSTDPAAFWDGVYADRPAAADPRPNVRLVEHVTGLPPGDVLDLGCGEGGDALWLARQRWRVTAVDVSEVAVRRLAGLAGAHGLDRLITAERHDLAVTFPSGAYDLVSAQFFQTPLALDRAGVLRTAAYAIRPGGVLLVVDHGSAAPWSWNRDPGVHYPTPGEVADGLALDPAEWTVERSEVLRRIATGPGGETAEVADHVLAVRRAV